MRRLILLVVFLIVILGGLSALGKYLPNLPKIINQPQISLPGEKVRVVTEESVIIDVVKKVKPSVVTVSAQLPQMSQSPFDFGPFSVDQNQPSQPQNIGSGFLVSSDGLVVTNKHVVSDSSIKYQVITNNDKKYDVQKIYRDPLNDVAILKIDPSQNFGNSLTPIELGDSSNLQVGQLVLAFGTPLGQFNNTVTNGIISGLGRGITASDQFQGFVEQLSNVIQTDAAISPGNSGGPLVNSSSQAIGVNTAIASGGQNIGFALPINVIKDSIKNFNNTGQFNRAYLGIAYKIVTRDLAILNNLPEGGYIQRVIPDSSADKPGIKKGDIITKIDDTRISQNQEISTIISKKKVGDTITITYWRDGKTQDVKVTLQAAPNQ